MSSHLVAAPTARIVPNADSQPLTRARQSTGASGPQLQSSSVAASIAPMAPSAASTTSVAHEPGASGQSLNLLQARMEAQGVHQPSVGRDFGVSDPKVDALLERYGLQGPAGRGRERIFKWAAYVQTAMDQALTPEDLAERLVATDIRRQVFLLEGILRLYRRHGEYGDVARLHHGAAKALEDKLGHFKDAQEFAELGRQQRVGANAQAALDRDAAQARNALAQELSENWIPDASGKSKAVGALLSDLMLTDWDGYAEDREYLRAQLTRHIRRMDRRDYDMDVPEDGIHQWRRHLRWIPIYAEALDGLVVLTKTPNPISEYKSLLNEPIAKSKFVQLPAPSREKDPFFVPLSLYAANMQLVLRLGDIKDMGEELEFIAHALEKGSGLRADEAMREAIRILDKPKNVWDDIHAQAHQAYDTAKQRGLMRALSDSLQ